MTVFNNQGVTAVVRGSNSSAIVLAAGDSRSFPLGGDIVHLVKFDAPTGELVTREILRAKYTFTLDISGGFNTELYALQGKIIKAEKIADAWPDAITGQNCPASVRELGTYVSDKSGLTDSTGKIVFDVSAMPIPYGILLSCDDEYGVVIQSAAASSHLEVDFGDAVGLQASLSPSAGIHSRETAVTLSWETVPLAVSWLAPTQVGATIEWYEDEASEELRTVDIGTGTSYTIPANTIAGSTLTWRVILTASSGAVTVSDWVTFYTVEPVGTVVPIAPVSRVLEDQNVTLSWSYSNAAGTIASASHVQFSADGETWTDVGTVQGSDCTITHSLPLTLGYYYWRVRCANESGDWSNWGSAFCILKRKPVPPSFKPTVITKPIPITWEWTSDDQVAYEIAVDGKCIERGFERKSWTLTRLLSEGLHKFGVRIQNQLGQWSDWAERTWQISYSNGVFGLNLYSAVASDGRVIISVKFALGNDNSFVIFRDGIELTQTNSSVITDRFCPAGMHNYEIMCVTGYQGATIHYIDGNIPRAAILSPLKCHRLCSFSVENPINYIALFDPEELKTIRCHYTMERDGGVEISPKTEVSYVHYAGSTFPRAEIGGAKDLSVRFAPAWPDKYKQLSAEFEALDGKTVHYRDPYGNAFFGVLSIQSKKHQRGGVVFDTAVRAIELSEAEAYERYGL